MSNFQIPQPIIAGGPSDELRAVDALCAQLPAALADDHFAALCVEVRLALD